MHFFIPLTAYCNCIMDINHKDLWTLNQQMQQDLKCPLPCKQIAIH